MMTIRDTQDSMVKKRWGVFHHYLWNKKVHPNNPEFEDWSRTVDRFDTDRLARTLHEIGAGYYFITLIHGTEYMLVPNPTYERIAGVPPYTLCPRRDLVADLYDSLSRYGIDLYLYLNAYTPLFPNIPKEIALRFAPDKENHRMPNPRFPNMAHIPTDDYVERWAAVLRDSAMRYGDKIKGWWIDSCYDYVGYTFDKIKLYYDAIKAGNPAAICGFNNGVKNEIIKWYPEEEMTCGEFNDFEFVPKERFVDGVQTQMLIPLGYLKNGGKAGWCTKTAKRDHAYLADYLAKLTAVGCPLTIDVYVYPDGSFEPSQLEILRGL